MRMWTHHIANTGTIDSDNCKSPMNRRLTPVYPSTNPIDSISFNFVANHTGLVYLNMNIAYNESKLHMSTSTGKDEYKTLM